MRTIIELPGDQLKGLDSLCRREGISRAEAIRQAVAALLEARAKTEAASAFGLWRGRGDDAHAAVEALRNEW
jgi:metal-responsive CopG/Arc/MetJ family transcriptional regulator